MYVIVHCVVRVSFLSKLGWKGLMTCLTKSLFLRDYWTKLDGVFAEMQIINYSLIFLKHIQINLINFESDWILMLKEIFGGQSYCDVTWNYGFSWAIRCIHVSNFHDRLPRGRIPFDCQIIMSNVVAYNFALWDCQGRLHRAFITQCAVACINCNF